MAGCSLGLRTIGGAHEQTDCQETALRRLHPEILRGRLEQEFNSLHAQREACEAYIASQRSEGWVLVRDQYDDGGISGGTLERPGLKRLLADVEDGLVDVVVVYKIDRLSRSLMDFSKLVEVFDRNGVTFVSVTQSFNTTTSMGRLTLNILLSFAQFEREVTAERIRDKVRASRMKGIWMGGVPPLGYEVKDRKLIVKEADAANVRWIFARFVEIGSGRGHCIKVALLSGSCERMENLCGIAKTIFPQWPEAIWVEWGVHVPQIIPGQTDMGPAKRRDVFGDFGWDGDTVIPQISD